MVCHAVRHGVAGGVVFLPRPPYGGVGIALFLTGCHILTELVSTQQAVVLPAPVALASWIAPVGPDFYHSRHGGRLVPPPDAATDRPAHYPFRCLCRWHRRCPHYSARRVVPAVRP